MNLGEIANVSLTPSTRTTELLGKIVQFGKGPKTLCIDMNMQAHYNRPHPFLSGEKIFEIYLYLSDWTIIEDTSNSISLGMTFTNMGRALASVGRVNEILDCEVDILSGKITDDKTVSEIEFKNVSFKYPQGKNKVLDDISFKINKGETIAIVGSTGCGKSTLVNLMVRFYDVTSGQILVDGIDVKDYDLNLLRQKIGLVLQKSELFAQTIKENIKWGNPNASDEEVELAAKIAQAHEFISTKELGYDEFVEEKGSSLSGGQKQRLSIARAILKRPDVLIFDDATSALDLVTEAKLHQGLHQYMSDSIKIIVAQRIATAKNADKIIVLDNGKVVAFDTHDVLLETSDIYQDIYNSQLKREGVFHE